MCSSIMYESKIIRSGKYFILTHPSTTCITNNYPNQSSHELGLFLNQIHSLSNFIFKKLFWDVFCYFPTTSVFADGDVVSCISARMHYAVTQCTQSSVGNHAHMIFSFLILSNQIIETSQISVYT
jgi:hypothetical protein